MVKNQGLGKCRCAFLTLLLAPLLLWSPAFAQSPEIQQAWEHFTKEHGTQWRVTWDAVLGTPRSLGGARSKPFAGDPEQAAKRFLAEHHALFQLRADLSDLLLQHLKHSPAGAHVTFEQRYWGLPVFNGGLEVHLTPGGEVFLVHNRYAPEAVLAQVSVMPSLSSDDAAQLAEADARAHVLSDKAGRPFQPGAAVVTVPPELGIYRVPAGYRLVYRVTVGVVRYVIDAHSGEILERTELIQFLDGTGQVFDPNPVNTLNDTTLRDNRDRNFPELAGAYFTRTLKDITQTGTGRRARFRLEGPFVKTENIRGGACPTPLGKAPPVRRDTNFVFTRNKSGFEHVMAYFHIDRNQRYIQSLGFLDINNRQHRVDAHGIREDNSFYCSDPVGSGYLAFGDGGVDDAEDADVILHEYGHSIQDNQTNGKYLVGRCDQRNETQAMGEGFGDYWAFSNNRPTGFDPACFAEWDAQGSCLRRLDSPEHYPEDIAGECHDDGEIWSSALRDLFLALGKETTDKLVLQSHFLIGTGKGDDALDGLNGNPQFCDGAQALKDADQALFGGANKNSIGTVMANRGIAGDLIMQNAVITRPAFSRSSTRVIAL